MAVAVYDLAYSVAVEAGSVQAFADHAVDVDRVAGRDAPADVADFGLGVGWAVFVVAVRVAVGVPCLALDHGAELDLLLG